MIAFDNVAYSYGGGELLSEISLRLAPGSFHFLTGPSGAGKSTFLKLCYAELLPTAGRVTLFDREVRSLTRDDMALHAAAASAWCIRIASFWITCRWPPM